MPRLLAALAAVLLASSSAQAQTMTGDEVLARSASAYARLSTYSGTTAVISELIIGDSIGTDATTAEVRFARPGRLRITGRDVRGNAYSLSSDGLRVQTRFVSRAAPGGDFAKMFRGTMRGDTLVADSLSLEIGVAALTGIGNRAPLYFPALVGLVGRSPLEHRTPSELLGMERCGASTCYEVQIKAPTARVTYMVDSTTFLLRSLKEEQISPEFDRFADQAVQSDPTGLAGAMLGMTRSTMRAATWLVVFSNVRVDAPLPDDSFQ